MTDMPPDEFFFALSKTEQYERIHSNRTKYAYVHVSLQKAQHCAALSAVFFLNFRQRR